MHIAIVMDGNGRWASKRFLPRAVGHQQGVGALRKIVAACPARHISALTVFAFSSENWNRPAEEVSSLMGILALALSKEVPQLQRDGVRIRFLGHRDNLSERVKKAFLEAELSTAANTKLTLNICFNYGGRWDIVQAASQLVAAGLAITEENIAKATSLADSGDPDLIIRTGNEMRLSNFLLWHAAYSELVFSELLWPDFDENALDAALSAYSSRERRFGKTSEQIKGE
ncbi:MAG: hypothetical protein RIR79_1811 [Pseudomonadota bacterium]|jgi:undecaprenyl diphosphate synthase